MYLSTTLLAVIASVIYKSLDLRQINSHNTVSSLVK